MVFHSPPIFYFRPGFALAPVNTIEFFPRKGNSISQQHHFNSYFIGGPTIQTRSRALTGLLLPLSFYFIKQQKEGVPINLFFILSGSRSTVKEVVQRGERNALARRTDDVVGREGGDVDGWGPSRVADSARSARPSRGWRWRRECDNDQKRKVRSTWGVVGTHVPRRP